jgi:hypothetical protein
MLPEDVPFRVIRLNSETTSSPAPTTFSSAEPPMKRRQGLSEGHDSISGWGEDYCEERAEGQVGEGLPGEKHEPGPDSRRRRSIALSSRGHSPPPSARYTPA